MSIIEIIANNLTNPKEMLSLIGQYYPNEVYTILFTIIFVETGLVIMPFLPGDSLLFAAGAYVAASSGNVSITTMIILLFIAAVTGDNLNYFIGRNIGQRAFSMNTLFFKKEYLDKTKTFYEKYGSKAVIIARFIPIVRTFAPFVAGVGAMNYARFLTFSIIGGALWIGGFLTLGYLFGNLEIVQKNFKVVILLIIGLSVMPPIIEFIKAKRAGKKAA